MSLKDEKHGSIEGAEVYMYPKVFQAYLLPNIRLAFTKINISDTIFKRRG